MTDTITFTQSLPATTDDQGLWVAIRNRTAAISFERYAAFIDEVFCAEPEPPVACDHVQDLIDSRRSLEHATQGTRAFETLRSATELFLLLNAGVYVHSGSYRLDPDALERPSDNPCKRSPGCRAAGNLGSEPLLVEHGGTVTEEDHRLPNREQPLSVDELKSMIESYLSGSATALPYFDRIVRKLSSTPGSDIAGTPFCDGLVGPRMNCPMLIELIWSYWLEMAGTVQTLKVIALRFQNRRTGAGRDPLADLDIAPLHPLSNLIWGYIQDEPHRLSVLRRAYEYDHHYGFTLRGRAIPELRPADSRTQFIEGFHNLLRAALAYFREASNTTHVPDGFPLLNALKEVHLNLAEGAGNQFGDLPWQARVEMLMEQWLLARPEMRNFLGGRVMVPYPTEWMSRVDTMRKLQSWGDTSVRYFYDLAVFGERLLLSCRYGDWSAATDQNQAMNWANYWRESIQGYTHAYRSVTGVDLSGSATDADFLQQIRTSPSDLIVTGS